jgi:hypothetical protein
MLTTVEACEMIFGDAGKVSMKKMYQATLKRHCKPVQVGGKGTKMWWSEKKVQAYLRKFGQRCNHPMVLTTH